MTDAELLSRLLDGELPPDDAAALRARIAAEPALARAWGRMQALPGRLGALPPPPIPMHLRARPPPPMPAPARASRTPWLVGAAVAALALLTLGARPSPPTVHIEDGSQLVEGEFVLNAGPARVALDGRARITVEPDGGVGRAVDPQEDPMTARTTAIGAAAGALITITVYEGRARLLAPEDGAKAIELRAGETRAVPVGRGTDAAPAKPPGPVSRTEGAAAAVARLEAELTALQEENESLRVKAAVAEGQLEAWAGSPVAFPEDMPRSMSPEGFSAHIEAALVGIDHTELMEVDCSEMPCLAVIRSTSPDEDWAEALEPLHGAGSDWGTDAKVNAVAMASEMDDDEDDAPPVRLMLVGAWPDDPDGPDVRSRLHTRSQDLIEGLGDDLMADEGRSDEGGEAAPD